MTDTLEARLAAADAPYQRGSSEGSAYGMRDNRKGLTSRVPPGFAPGARSRGVPSPTPPPPSGCWTREANT